MEHKNTVVSVAAIIALVIGLMGGYFIWGNRPQPTPIGSSANMSSMMMNMGVDLQGKTGDAFDQEFLAEMIVHHQGAIDMAKLALTNAKHQEIKDLAKNIITAQTNEIGEMKTWQKTWYNQ